MFPLLEDYPWLSVWGVDISKSAVAFAQVWPALSGLASPRRPLLTPVIRRAEFVVYSATRRA